jgi:phenylacetate-CoA ligase
LRKKDVHFLIGYASAIIELAEYINSCNDTPDMYDVKGVMVLAEPFSDIMREKAVKAFGCPVIAKYSSQETGVIACECPDQYEYHINNTSFIVELLEINSDKPAGNGQMGRVVITDLFSHAMPLIRYDIGDLAILSPSHKCGLDTLMFERIEGRIAAAVFNTSDNMVHFASIVNRVWDMKNVLMYQFIQESKKEYTLKIVPLPGYDPGQENFYSMRMKEVLGEDAQIKFDKVEDIPPLNSGKRPFYVNNYRKNTPSTMNASYKQDENA